MPREKGSKVVVCLCGAKMVGMPGNRVKCSKCGKSRKVPMPKAPKKAAPQKAAKKKAAKK